MEPQMIRVKENLSPSSHLHSEKIRISRDAAIFEIKRELPGEGGAKFSSRYEIYNSTTKPFGKSYRELTLSSSASGVSSSCGSHTSSVSSSGLSETTTYITCSSEIEPVQMTGFQCIDESSAKHRVSIFNEECYEDIHEATNYDLRANATPEKTESEDNASEKDIVADTKPFSNVYVSTLQPATEDRRTTTTVTDDASDKGSQLVHIETWSSSSPDAKDEPLKTPILLKQMISNFDDRLLYEVPQTSTKTTYQEEEYTYEPALKTTCSKTVTKCRSLLNLDLKTDDAAASSPHSISPSPPPPPSTVTTKPTMSKAISEMNLTNDDDERAREKKRITKTISIMLENRRKQQNEAAAATKTATARVVPAPGDTNADSHELNEKLINDNVVLVELQQQQQQQHPFYDRKMHTIDRSCRVTGEILKNKSPAVVAYGDYPDRNVYTLPRSVKSHRSQLQRHFYYPQYAARSGTRVRDEELPDPDKVKHARELFERVLKLGSLENVNRPRSPPRKGTPGQRPTPEIRQPLDGRLAHTKLRKSLSVDTGHAIEQAPCKWTDNGSLSSGVGSDISADTDLELSPKGGASGTISGSECGSKEDVIFTSEEDLYSGAQDHVEEPGKPISQDVLSNIRAYGTSVTYYGGKIIASSQGYTCSPMTMTIMNEIRQSSPDYHANRRFLFDDKQISKFRLIKSNSCGSRLELSGTEEYGKEYEGRLNGAALEDYNNNETKRETDTIKEEEDEEELAKRAESWPKTKETVVMFENKNEKCNEKNWPKGGGNIAGHGEKAAKPSYCDMEFEEYQVLEERS